MKTSKIALLSLGGIVLGTVVVAAVVTRVVVGWGGQVGDDPGELTTASRDLTGFSSIEINGAWSVEVTQGDGWQVDLSYPENQLPAIDVSVNGERLILNGTRPESLFGGPDMQFSAAIVMPALEELDVSGSGRVWLSGFEGARLEIDVAGATRIIGEDGRYRALELSVAGASDIQFAEFVFTDANVDLAGASNLALTMDGGELTGSLAGAGRIEYAGTVSREAVDVAGFGWVGRADD